MANNPGLGRAEIARRLRLGKELSALTKKIVDQAASRGITFGLARSEAAIARQVYANEHYQFGDNVQRDDTMVVAEKFAEVPDHLLVLMPWEALRILRYHRTPNDYAVKIVRLMAHHALHRDCPNGIMNTTGNAKKYATPDDEKMQEINEKFEALQEELRVSPESELVPLQEIDQHDVTDLFKEWDREDQQKIKEEITPMTLLSPEFALQLERIIKDNVNLEEVKQAVEEIKSSSGVNLDPLIDIISASREKMDQHIDMANLLLDELKTNNSLNEENVSLRKDLTEISRNNDEFDYAMIDLQSRLKAEHDKNELLKAQIEIQQSHLATIAILQGMAPETLRIYQEQVVALKETNVAYQAQIVALKKKIEELEKNPVISVEEIREKVKQEMLKSLG